LLQLRAAQTDQIHVKDPYKMKASYLLAALAAAGLVACGKTEPAPAPAPAPKVEAPKPAEAPAAAPVVPADAPKADEPKK
jgi:hypothetical protein